MYLYTYELPSRHEVYKIQVLNSVNSLITLSLSLFDCMQMCPYAIETKTKLSWVFFSPLSTFFFIKNLPIQKTLLTTWFTLKVKVGMSGNQHFI